MGFSATLQTVSIHEALQGGRQGSECARQVNCIGLQLVPGTQLPGHSMQDCPSCRVAGLHMGAAAKKLRVVSASYTNTCGVSLAVIGAGRSWLMLEKGCVT